MTLFKGRHDLCIYDLQLDVMLFDVSYLKNVRFLVHLQKEEIKVNRGAAYHAIFKNFLFASV